MHYLYLCTEKVIRLQVSIPFGIIGAIWGHFIFGRSINMMSIYGFIALTGVVVNDSLILVDFINRAKGTGKKMIDIVKDAGCQRFRAILLTSLTTFFGIFPLYFEGSLQAQFIIPMAISLGFGNLLWRILMTSSLIAFIVGFSTCIVSSMACSCPYSNLNLGFLLSFSVTVKTMALCLSAFLKILSR